MYSELALFGGGTGAYISLKSLLKNGRLTMRNIAQTFEETLDDLDQKLEICIYNKQEKEIAKEPYSPEDEVNCDLVLSSISLTAVTLGYAGSSPFLVTAGMGISSSNIFDTLKKAYQKIFYEKKIDRFAKRSAMFSCFIITQQYWGIPVIFFLFHYSEALIMSTQNRVNEKIASTFLEQPTSARVIRDGQKTEICCELLEKNDIVEVHTGEIIPVDGKIIQGFGTIDQQKLTGESQPAEKKLDDYVYATTMVVSGNIHISIEKSGEETTARKIFEILQNTKNFKDTIVSRGIQESDKVAMPLIIGTIVATPIIGLSNSVGVMYTPFGSVTVFTGPICMLNFLKIASEEGVLIKDGRILDLMSEIDTVIFDKTGTLTKEKQDIHKIHMAPGFNENEVLRFAAAAEYCQKHPIAIAILEKAKEKKIELPLVLDASYEVGFGIKVKIDDKIVRVGSQRYIEMENISMSFFPKLEDLNSTQIFVALDNEVIGVIEMRPQIRAESKKIINYFKQKNIETVIISGDQKQPTKKIAEELGIENYFAEVLPHEKSNIVADFQHQGHKVCFVGDGINDSLALKKAHVSISLADASHIAVDTAQIVLMDHGLEKIVSSFEIAGEYQKNMTQNIKLSNSLGFLAIGSLFLGGGLVTTFILTEMSFFTSTFNSMYPKSKYTSKNKGANNAN